MDRSFLLNHYTDDIATEKEEVVHNSLEITSNLVISKKTAIWDLYSSWQKLVRHITYINLVIRNCR